MDYRAENYQLKKQILQLQSQILQANFTMLEQEEKAYLDSVKEKEEAQMELPLVS